MTLRRSIASLFAIIVVIVAGYAGFCLGYLIDVRAEAGAKEAERQLSADPSIPDEAVFPR